MQQDDDLPFMLRLHTVSVLSQLEGALHSTSTPACPAVTPLVESLLLQHVLLRRMTLLAAWHVEPQAGLPPAAAPHPDVQSQNNVR